MSDEMKDFLRELAAASRTTQSLGMTSNTAYEEEDALLLPDQPSEEDERLFLGPVEELPQAPSSTGILGEAQEEDLSSCGTMEAEDAEVARVMGYPSDVAPPPLTSEFVFLKPVERCGQLEHLYKAFQRVMVDGQETTSFSMDGQEFTIQKKPTIQILDQANGLLYGASKVDSEFPHLTASDLLIWVSKVKEGKIVGYILNGWCYGLAK